jgi:hypothetical protein
LLRQPDAILCTVRYNGIEEKWNVKPERAEQFSGSEKVEEEVQRLRSWAIDHMQAGSILRRIFCLF